MRCSGSVFENEEDTPGWKEGKFVACCEKCFNETMKRRGSSEGQDDAVCKEDITLSRPHSSTGSTETFWIQPVREETGNIEGRRS